MFCFCIKRYRIYSIFILAVYCLVPKRLKTLIMHVSRNVLSFPHTGCFTCIFKLMYVTDLKRLKIHVFDKVFLFGKVIRVCCTCFSILERKKFKTLKTHAFSNVILHFYIRCFPCYLAFSYLTRWKKKNT